MFHSETGPKPPGYKCQFCLQVFAKGPSGWSNLNGHCDGSESQPVCPNCHKATSLRLPPTFKQQESKKNKSSSGPLHTFVLVVKFSVELFNQILVIWVLLHALPWALMEDVPLQASFSFSNISESWAQLASTRLYEDMLKTVIQELNVSQSTLFIILRVKLDSN